MLLILKTPASPEIINLNGGERGRGLHAGKTNYTSKQLRACCCERTTPRVCCFMWHFLICSCEGQIQHCYAATVHLTHGLSPPHLCPLASCTEFRLHSTRVAAIGIHYPRCRKPSVMIHWLGEATARASGRQGERLFIIISFACLLRGFAFYLEMGSPLIMNIAEQFYRQQTGPSQAVFWDFNLRAKRSTQKMESIII